MTRRVVSLLPSTTEIVVALGHGSALVGRSHDCDFPDRVVDLPVVSRPRRDPVGPSRRIHDDVSALLEEVLSVYEVDPDALRAAAPDLIITQDLCRVCAIPEDDVVAAARELLGVDVEVLTSSPLTLDEVFEDVRRIGAALDDRAAAERLVTRLRDELAAVASAVGGRDRPRLALLEWADPLITGGNWAPELAEVAGTEPVLGTRGGHSPTIDVGALVEADPDVIVVAPCGFGLEAAVAEHSTLAALPGWGDLSAVRNGRVAFADGSSYFNRPGPRLVDSAAILAAVAHGVGPAASEHGQAWRLG